HESVRGIGRCVVSWQSEMASSSTTVTLPDAHQVDTLERDASLAGDFQRVTGNLDPQQDQLARDLTHSCRFCRTASFPQPGATAPDLRTFWTMQGIRMLTVPDGTCSVLFGRRFTHPSCHRARTLKQIVASSRFLLSPCDVSPIRRSAMHQIPSGRRIGQVWFYRGILIALAL